MPCSVERTERTSLTLRRRSSCDRLSYQSEAELRFPEGMLRVVQTQRLQGRSVSGYLYEALVAHRSSLLAVSACDRIIG